MGRLLAELKRRNVFKVATVYVVVSWLVLQVADVVFPVFDIPLWGSRLVVVLLGLGFPIAVVLAWAFDLTPEGIEWESRATAQQVRTHAWDWILAALLVVAIALMVANQLSKWRPSDAVPTASRDAAAVDERRTVGGNRDEARTAASAPVPYTIAVLPFDNLSPDSGDSYFSDGLAEELLSVLARVDELKVASRTATAYYRDKNVDRLTVAATLNVDNVLSGSVRRAGDTIRVTAVLDSAETGELLWTETYDRTLDDILDIQTDIARSVAQAVVPVLSPESASAVTARPTISSEAYDFYLRGRDYLRRPDQQSTLTSATELFDRAIDLDPRFAEAYAGRCEALLSSYQYTLKSSYFEQAEIACHRALTLDDALWDVHVALGSLYRTNGQFDRAIVELEAAIRLQPNAVDPYLELASIYSEQSRLEEAEAMFRRAESVESGYWRVHNEFGHFFYDQSEYDEAIRRYERVAELAPDNGIGYDNLGNAYLAIGDLTSAERAFNDSPLPSRWTYTNRGLVYYYQGKFAEAVDDQKRAIELAPDVHRAWGRLGDAYRFIPGSEAEAREAYLTAIELAEQELEINPSSWDAVARLGLYYARIGRDEKAEAQLDKLFEMTADETAYYFAALISLGIDERDQALDYLRESLDRGFSKRLIRSDPDLAALEGNDEFDALVTAR